MKPRDAPRPAMRPAGKARRGSKLGICDPGATPSLVERRILGAAVVAAVAGPFAVRCAPLRQRRWRDRSSAATPPRTPRLCVVSLITISSQLGARACAGNHAHLVMATEDLRLTGSLQPSYSTLEWMFTTVN